MTRFARIHAPPVGNHVIARFVNRAYRLAADVERVEYLRRLGRHLGECDWRLLGYALMSSHVHLVLRAGADPSARLIAPLHTGFALWLNRLHERLGPVFASRHSTIACADERVGPLLAYVHNNPVRAGVVAWAGDSTWTSHRAYAGLEATPTWLDADAGLRASGFLGTGAATRFDTFVRAHAASPRDPTWCETPAREQNAGRQARGGPGRATWPRVEPAGRVFGILTAGALRPRWPGEPEEVVRLAARHMGVVMAEILGPERRAALVATRRVALLAWTGALGRPQAEMARCLRRSDAAASRLLHANPEAVAALRHEAEWVAAVCLEATAANQSGVAGVERKAE